MRPHLLFLCGGQAFYGSCGFVPHGAPEPSPQGNRKETAGPKNHARRSSKTQERTARSTTWVFRSDRQTQGFRHAPRRIRWQWPCRRDENATANGSSVRRKGRWPLMKWTNTRMSEMIFAVAAVVA